MRFGTPSTTASSWLILVLIAVLLTTACDEQRSPIAVVVDCIDDADASEECIDAWNAVVLTADPGMRQVMTEYDRCIEAGGWSPFDPEKCVEELRTLTALFP